MLKSAPFNGKTINVKTQREFSFRDIAPQEWLCGHCFTLKHESQFRSFTVCKDC